MGSRVCAWTGPVKWVPAGADAQPLLRLPTRTGGAADGGDCAWALACGLQALAAASRRGGGCEDVSIVPTSATQQQQQQRRVHQVWVRVYQADSVRCRERRVQPFAAQCRGRRGGGAGGVSAPCCGAVQSSIVSPHSHTTDTGTHNACVR